MLPCRLICASTTRKEDQTQIIEAVTGRCEMAIEQDALTVSTRPGLQVLRQGPAWPLKDCFQSSFEAQSRQVLSCWCFSARTPREAEHTESPSCPAKDRVCAVSGDHALVYDVPRTRMSHCDSQLCSCHLADVLAKHSPFHCYQSRADEQRFPDGKANLGNALVAGLDICPVELNRKLC